MKEVKIRTDADDEIRLEIADDGSFELSIPSGDTAVLDRDSAVIFANILTDMLEEDDIEC